MKKQETRMMSEGPSVKVKKLLCKRDCDFPGIGFFEKGQVVEDQRMVAIIADNPNFEKAQEE